MSWVVAFDSGNLCIFPQKSVVGLFLEALKDCARKTENLEASPRRSRSRCSLPASCRPGLQLLSAQGDGLALLAAGFDSRAEETWLGGVGHPRVCVTTPPCPPLLVPTADTLQLCPAVRQTWVCLSVPRVGFGL